MTRKILLISDDKQFKDNLYITTLALTKLNHQITFTNDISDKYTDYILLDLDTRNGTTGFELKINMIKEFRAATNHSSKKIIAIYSNDIPNLKTRVFVAGCDSIMKKSEFQSVVNNILTI